MRIDRMLTIIVILLNRRRISAKALAEKFEVSVRTVYRDIEAINMAGIPVVSYPGNNGGFGILEIQDEVNQAAKEQGMPEVTIINDRELDRIEELIANNTWPNQWDGTEVRGDAMLPEILPDGNIQQVLFDDKDLWG